MPQPSLLKDLRPNPVVEVPYSLSRAVGDATAESGKRDGLSMDPIGRFFRDRIT